MIVDDYCVHEIKGRFWDLSIYNQRLPDSLQVVIHVHICVLTVTVSVKTYRIDKNNDTGDSFRLSAA